MSRPMWLIHLAGWLHHHWPQGEWCHPAMHEKYPPLVLLTYIFPPGYYLLPHTYKTVDCDLCALQTHGQGHSRGSFWSSSAFPVELCILYVRQAPVMRYCITHFVDLTSLWVKAHDGFYKFFKTILHQLHAWLAHTSFLGMSHFHCREGSSAVAIAVMSYYYCFSSF